MVLRSIRSLVNLFLNLLFPPMCVNCNQFLRQKMILCFECKKMITPIISTTIDITATKKMKLFAISAYQDPIRSLILAKGRSDIVASQKLGQLMWEETFLKNQQFDVVVPVPLHWTRFAKRGFNQSYEMAKIIAQKSEKPVINLLRRKKRTAFQSTLSKDKRIENLKEAFCLCSVKVSNIEGKHIMLVDDLLTTGATLRAAARQLYTLKPASISAVVASRVI